MTKNKPIYHTQNINQWKGLGKTSTLPSIHGFIFGHVVVIHFVLVSNIIEILKFSMDTIFIKYHHHLVWQSLIIYLCIIKLEIIFNKISVTI